MSDSSEANFAVHSQYLDNLSQHGLQSLANGRYTEAAVAFEQVIALDSTHVEAHHGLVRALREDGRFEDAVRAATLLTELTPLDPLAFASLSIALQKAGRISEAEASAARARVLEWKLQLSDTQFDPERQAWHKSAHEEL